MDPSTPVSVSNAIGECPACGSARVSEHREAIKFEYGVGTETIQVSAQVPVCHCEDCGFSFMDERAETLRHDAVCRAIRILTPAELKAIRERYGLSQQDFAGITRIGRASLNRWETGSLFQSGSIDSLLYLLGFAENLDRLRLRFQTGKSASRSERPTGAAARRFRCIENEEFATLERDARTFCLYVTQ